MIVQCKHLMTMFSRLNGYPISNVYLTIQIILIGLEVVAALLAIRTLNEITSELMFLIIGLNVIPGLLYIINFKKAALVGAVLIASAIVPYQLVLGHRYVQLKQESENVVDFVYDYYTTRGSFPSDLSEYDFENPTLSEYITYERQATQDFTLTYFVGDPLTAHFYHHQSGGEWRFEPR